MTSDHWNTGRKAEVTRDHLPGILLHLDGACRRGPCPGANRISNQKVVDDGLDAGMRYGDAAWRGAQPEGGPYRDCLPRRQHGSRGLSIWSKKGLSQLKSGPSSCQNVGGIFCERTCPQTSCAHCVAHASSD
eukprot:550746-Pyramimonas_sp.AAC.1